MRALQASIPEAFAVASSKYRHRIALADGAQEFTYEQLAAKADRIASRLHARGIGKRATVGLLARRSADTVAAILGILKIGAAYVPLDPSYPKQFLQDIYADSAPSAILVQDSVLAQGPEDVSGMGRH